MSENDLANAAERGAFAALSKKCLSVGGETVLPNPLNLSNPLVLRNPPLWLCIFEKRNLKAHHFTTEDDSKRKMVLAFGESLAKLFSGRVDPPFPLPSDQAVDGELLVCIFQSLGMLYVHVPLPVDSLEDAVDALLRVAKPSLEEAKRILRRMNARIITLLGGSGERFATSGFLDPILFNTSDRDAVKKATIRAEAPLDSRDGRKRLRRDARNDRLHDDQHRIPADRAALNATTRACTKCQKPFTGSWSSHVKKGDCKK